MPTFQVRLNNLWRFISSAAFAFATFLIVFLFAAIATAQEVAVPALSDDPLKAISSTAENIATGKWWAAAAAAVSFFTWVFRSGVLLKLPKTGGLAFLGRAGTWLATNPITSFGTPFFLSAVLAVVTTAMNGTPLTFASISSEVLKIGAGAIATFIGLEKLKEAKNARVLAAAGITTQQQALDELSKRVISGEVVPPPTT